MSTAKGRLFIEPHRALLATSFATIYVVCSKVNFTNLNRYSALSERTYRRQLSELYGFMPLNQALIPEAIALERFQVGVIDASFVPESGKATYGLDRFYNDKARTTKPERQSQSSQTGLKDLDDRRGRYWSNDALHDDPCTSGIFGYSKARIFVLDLDFTL